MRRVFLEGQGRRCHGEYCIRVDVGWEMLGITRSEGEEGVRWWDIQAEPVKMLWVKASLKLVQLDNLIYT